MITRNPALFSALLIPRTISFIGTLLALGVLACAPVHELVVSAISELPCETTPESVDASICPMQRLAGA